MAGGRGVLTVVRGPDTGQVWNLEPYNTYTLGRSSKNTFQLSDTTVSARHATVSYVDGIWFIHDNASKHGTYVNGEQPHAKRAIFDRDMIRVGKTYLRFSEAASPDP